MVNIRQIIFLITFILLSMNLTAGEFYSVKKTENLSNILYSLNLKPIYGKHGTLKQTLKLNPLIKHSGHLIYAGKIIKLPLEKNILDITNIAVDSKTNIKNDTANFLPNTNIDTPNNIARSISEFSRESYRVNDSEGDKDQYIFLRLAPQMSWLKSSSTSSTNYLVSQINTFSKASPGILGTFGINVSEVMNIFVFSNISNVIFYENEQYNVMEKKFIRQDFGIGGEYHFDPTNQFSLKCGFYDEFFLTMKKLNYINIETSQLPEMFWEYHRVLKQYKNVTVKAGIFGKFILPYNTSNISGKFGYGLGGDVLLMIQKKGLRFFYNFSNVKAQNKSTKTYELGWSIVYEGKFFE